MPMPARYFPVLVALALTTRHLCLPAVDAFFIHNENHHGHYDTATTTSSTSFRLATRKAKNLFAEPNGSGGGGDNSSDPVMPSGMAGDFRRRLKRINWDKIEDADDEYTAQEAVISAALYMNAATERIAPHVRVSWEPDVADIILRLEKVSNPNRPFMVGVVGIPGSGKSTSVDTLSAYLGDDRCATIPMDGYHFSLAELSKFPNPADVIYRRGAPDTFDVFALARDLERIAFGSQPEVSVPGFDHAKGDPEENQHKFVRDQHKIVICEGIYLLHDKDQWETIEKFFDWTIYIDSDIDKCIERLKRRNKCIPGYTEEEIEERCEVVDRANCEVAQDSARKFACQIVPSGA